MNIAGNIVDYATAVAAGVAALIIAVGTVEVVILPAIKYVLDRWKRHKAKK